MKIFGDTKMTIEDLIKEKGQLVKKGTLSEDGDFEVWADGTVTNRTKPAALDEGVGSQQAVLGEKQQDA